MKQSIPTQKKPKLGIEERNYQTMAKEFDLHIGIDTGVNTGIAVWDKRRKMFIYLNTVDIDTAKDKVLFYLSQGWRICVRIEDARRRHIGETKKQMYLRHAKGDMRTTGEISAMKAQGVGSVKRDAVIWEKFLIKNSIDYILVAPRQNMTKVSPEYFQTLTKIDSVKLLGKGKAEHVRDAAMLVFQR